MGNELTSAEDGLVEMMKAAMLSPSIHRRLELIKGTAAPLKLRSASEPARKSA